MDPVVVTVGNLAAAVANNILTSITPTSGTALTLNGTTVTGGVATLDSPRQILLTFGNEAANRTLVLTGTNSDNGNIQETLAIPSGAGGTIPTVGSFLTVTNALPLGGGWTAAITIGTNTIASSPWKIPDRHIGPVNIAFSGVATGTVSWGLEYSYTAGLDNFPTQIGPAGGTVPPIPTVWTHVDLNNEVGNAESTTNDPFYAWRLTLYSGTGSVTLTAIQSGLPPVWT